MDPYILIAICLAVVIVAGAFAKKHLGFNPFKGLEKTLERQHDVEDKAEISKLKSKIAELKATQQERRAQTRREIAEAAVKNNDKNGPPTPQ